MKTVHTPDMVAHLWAHQSQPRARNAGDTFYFDGSTIYSYGSHFPIAKLVIDDPESPNPYPRAVLFTTRDYSPTTQRHIAMARNAVRHLRLVYVNNPRATLKENLEHERLNVFRLVVRCNESKRGPQLRKRLRELEEGLAQYNQLAEYMGKPTRQVPEDFNEAVLAHRRAEAGKRAALTRKHNADMLARLSMWEGRLGAFSGWLELWRTRPQAVDRWTYEQLAKVAAKRDGVAYPTEWPCMLADAGDEVLTSWGARVPLTDAKRIYKVWARVQGKVTPQGWAPSSQNDARVGAFRVDRIAPDGTLHAGCHTIHPAEIRAFGKRMGWEG